MANRPKGYGFSREVAQRMDAKYSEEDEMEIVDWISMVADCDPPEPGKDAFHEWLKDGQVLCKLMNEIVPGSCKPNPPGSSTIPAMIRNKEMENIGMFLKAAENLGVPRLDLFQTVDLYEKGNLSQVQVAMYKLSAIAKQKGFDKHSIGVKIADKNVRDHDEQKLREGRNVIGLQMGTNQVASQGGMTPYGLGRQLTQQKK